MLTERLKQLRAELGRTQEQVASALGISRATYSHVENGRNDPDSELLSKMASYYSVTTDFLLGRTNQRNHGQEAPKEIAIDDKQTVLTFEGKPIPEDDRELMLRLLRGGRK
jgi:transcriptional regulator with XRE-family HTH domain